MLDPSSGAAVEVFAHVGCYGLGDVTCGDQIVYTGSKVHGVRASVLQVPSGAHAPVIVKVHGVHSVFLIMYDKPHGLKFV